jgi:hypothetical protein
MRRWWQLASAGVGIALWGLAGMQNPAPGAETTPPGPPQPRIRIALPADTPRPVKVEGENLFATPDEIRASGEVSITLPGGARLQVSQMLVRVSPSTGIILMEPLRPAATTR